MIAMIATDVEYIVQSDDRYCTVQIVGDVTYYRSFHLTYCPDVCSDIRQLPLHRSVSDDICRELYRQYATYMNRAEAHWSASLSFYAAVVSVLLALLVCGLVLIEVL